MIKLLLIFSLSLGLANPVFAVSRAAEVIGHGKILHETVKSNVDEKTGDTYYVFKYVISYMNSIYDCKVSTKSKTAMCCLYVRSGSR